MYSCVLASIYLTGRGSGGEWLGGQGGGRWGGGQEGYYFVQICGSKSGRLIKNYTSTDKFVLNYLIQKLISFVPKSTFIFTNSKLLHFCHSM